LSNTKYAGIGQTLQSIERRYAIGSPRFSATPSWVRTRKPTSDDRRYPFAAIGYRPDRGTDQRTVPPPCCISARSRHRRGRARRRLRTPPCRWAAAPTSTGPLTIPEPVTMLATRGILTPSADDCHPHRTLSAVEHWECPGSLMGHDRIVPPTSPVVGPWQLPPTILRLRMSRWISRSCRSSQSRLEARRPFTYFVRTCRELVS
jgi:hypothetical protein